MPQIEVLSRGVSRENNRTCVRNMRVESDLQVNYYDKHDVKSKLDEIFKKTAFNSDVVTRNVSPDTSLEFLTNKQRVVTEQVELKEEIEIHDEKIEQLFNNKEPPKAKFQKIKNQMSFKEFKKLYP